MTKVKKEPVVRKRVRTGCLTCRRKHKKCDENRNPKCDFCTLKGLDCIWPESVKKEPYKTFKKSKLQLDDTQASSSQLKSDLSSFIITGTKRHMSTTEVVSPLFQFDPTIAFNGVEKRRHTTDLSGLDDFDAIGLTETLDNLDYNSFLNISPKRLFELPTTLRDHLAIPKVKLEIMDELPNNQSTFNLFNDKTHYEEPVISEEMKLMLLENYVQSVATWLDMFNGDDNVFVTDVVRISETNKVLFYSILALSSRHLECQNTVIHDNTNLTLAFYQYALQELEEISDVFDNSFVCSCLLLTCFEIISVEPTKWRTHLESVSFLFNQLDGSSEDNLQRSMFWCFARLDLASVKIGEQPTILSVQNFYNSELSSYEVFASKSNVASVNYIFYLACKITNLISDHFPVLEFDSEWCTLWEELNDWFKLRPVGMREVMSWKNDEFPFPKTLFLNNAAICGNQIWHMCYILMVQNKPRHFKLENPVQSQPMDQRPSDTDLRDESLNDLLSMSKPSSICSDSLSSPESVYSLFPENTSSPSSEISPPTQIVNKINTSNHSPIWHAKQICGISLTNMSGVTNKLSKPSDSNKAMCQINSLQPLCIASRLISSRYEHGILLKLFKDMEHCGGFGGMFWKGKELCEYWQNEC